MTLDAADWLGLIALVFALGVKHGFDPDHLVAIDGLARSSARPAGARWSGLFFSLGHGLVVTLVGVAVAIAASDWQVPELFRHLGAWISIGVLLVLGTANLLVALRAPAGAAVSPVGLRSRWASERLERASHPAVIASIGAAFALSFDTISHALLFSLTGAAMAGALFAAALGVVFTLGMMLTDTLNGLWVARMIRRADRRAASASRWMSIAIALLCLVLAAMGLAKYALPAVEDRAGALGPLVSLATVLVLVAAYALADRAARARERVP